MNVYWNVQTESRISEILWNLQDSQVFEVGASTPTPAREKAKKATAQMPPYCFLLTIFITYVTIHFFKKTEKSEFVFQFVHSHAFCDERCILKSHGGTLFLYIYNENKVRSIK
jgi:hypothetical protein